MRPAPSLNHSASTTYKKSLAREPASLLGGQKDNHIRHILRLAYAAQRRLGGNPLPFLERSTPFESPRGQRCSP